MPAKESVHNNSSRQNLTSSPPQNLSTPEHSPLTASLIQRARLNPHTLTSGHIQTLQRTLGNQRVEHLLTRPSPPIQRTITVHTKNIDPNTLKNRIQAANTIPAPKKGPLKNAVNTVNTANFVATDVPTLAQEIINNCAGLTAPERGQIRPALENLIGDMDLTGFNVDVPKGVDEAGAFQRLIDVAGARASRSKNTPTVLPQGELPGDLGAKVAAAVAIVGNINVAMGAAVNQGAADQVIWDAQGTLDLREPHENGSNWLPAVAIPALPAPAPFDDQAWQNYGALSRSGVPSAYAEVTVKAALGIDGWRLVYDYVNDIYYLTLHYHWHKGYNPFFRLN